MILGILNEFEGCEEDYIKSCESLGIKYKIIDFISNDWVDNIIRANCDGYLVRPSYQKEVWKKMYDEKLFLLNKVMGKPIYPTYEELFIYENKKNVASWLRIKEINHPKTWIYYRKKDALDFIHGYSDYPIVFKTSIGSAAIGVKYIETKKEALRLVERIFTKWRFYNLGYTKWCKTKYGLSYPLMDDKQYNFIIFQEKINVKYEWRMIKIGDSYFGHQKISNGKFHSGSNLVGWVKPPEELLHFTKLVCELGNFNSMALDIFEDINGTYYINELQSIFGSYSPSQMFIEGKPGRFRYEGREWKFEEGYFNKNGSCDLRVIDFISILNKTKRI